MFPGTSDPGTCDLLMFVVWKVYCHNNIQALCRNIFTHIKACTLLAEGDCSSIFSLASTNYLFENKLRHIKSTDCKYVRALLPEAHVQRCFNCQILLDCVLRPSQFSI